MGLLDIKKYMMQVKFASLATLCSCLNTEPDLLRCMLNHWINKGCMRKLSKTPSCGGKCMKCGPEITEIYEWVA